MSSRAMLLVSVVALPVFAQSIPQADVDQMWLDPMARGSLLVGNGAVVKGGDFRLAAALTYARSPLRGLLDDRLGAQLAGGVGIANWLEVGAVVPVFFSQWGSSSINVANAGLGNPWLSAKFGLLDSTHPFQLAFSVGVGVPVGTGVAQGNGGLEVASKLSMGKVYRTFQLGLELGVLVRPAVSYTGLTGDFTHVVGSQASLAGLVSSVNATGIRGEASVRTFVNLDSYTAGAEAQVGIRWPTGTMELFASAGPGFAGGIGTPEFRMYLGASFAGSPATQAPCTEGEPYELTDCPELDRDGDGVSNAKDAAPLEAEDKDGFQDEDGKPDADNDADGVLDGADACPNTAGPNENRGCPDVDGDGDGLIDRLDKCPTDAEDKDGFEDTDGCPECDNDKDGVNDCDDACPLDPGTAAAKGCPVHDADKDGVPDEVDLCPAEAGLAENQGCPAARKLRVSLSVDKVVIREKVFFDSGKAAVQKKSFPLLDDVAMALVNHPAISHVRIEAHTDNVGKAEKNKKLSQERAEAVKAYLVKKGVVATRLEAVGYGQEKPADVNTTAAGRENNRRVEFAIVSEKDTSKDKYVHPEGYEDQ